MGREAFLAEVRRTLPGTLEEDGSTALLLPRSAHEVAVAMQLARRLDGPVIVPGGEAQEGAVHLDLRRLGEVIAFDDASRLVHVQGGMEVSALEDALRARGLTLGMTEAAPDVALCEWLAVGAPGSRDHADDPVDQLVAGLEVVLPDGRPLAIRPAPRRAVGPDLTSAQVGARGALGVIIGAHLVVRARRAAQEVAHVFPTREAAESARAWIRGRGVRPAHTRVVDVAEGSVLHVRLEAEGALARASLAVVAKTARERNGVPYPADEVPQPRAADAPPAAPIVHLLGDALR
ncbi:MAG: FAD-binding oxidoreductase [Myxococcota bacterium]